MGRREQREIERAQREKRQRETERDRERQRDRETGRDREAEGGRTEEGCLLVLLIRSNVESGLSL